VQRYTVRFTREAEDDLLRLYDFLIEQDVAGAERALGAIHTAFGILEFSPFSCRRANMVDSPFFRELIVPFGSSGYVALFEIETANKVTILAVRHQREADYW
jgi:plasmid stabilization system protein ParE